MAVFGVDVCSCCNGAVSRELLLRCAVETNTPDEGASVSGCGGDRQMGVVGVRDGGMAWPWQGKDCRRGGRVCGIYANGPPTKPVPPATSTCNLQLLDALYKARRP